MYKIFREIADATHSFEHDVLYGALGSDILHSGPFSLAGTVRSMGGRQTFVLSDAHSVTVPCSGLEQLVVLALTFYQIWPHLSAELAPLKAKWKSDPYVSTEEPSRVEQ